MEQFRIEVANNGSGHVYNIKPLGSARYQIYREEELIGTIQLDEKDHRHCKSEGCEMDMPLIGSIRDAIHSYKQNN